MESGFKERLPEESVPEDVDWDLWLGNAPFVPFNGAGYQKMTAPAICPLSGVDGMTMELVLWAIWLAISWIRLTGHCN